MVKFYSIKFLPALDDPVLHLHGGFEAEKNGTRRCFLRRNNYKIIVLHVKNDNRIALCAGRVVTVVCKRKFAEKIACVEK
jgi:hypothetical protein